SRVHGNAQQSYRATQGAHTTGNALIRRRTPRVCRTAPRVLAKAFDWQAHFFITASETRPYTHSPRKPDPRTPDPGALTGQNRRKTVYQSEHGQDSITVNLPEIRGIFGSRSDCRGRTPWP